MTIRFIPNDPFVVAELPERRKKPRVNPSGGRATFTYVDPASEGVYDIGSPQFLFWQCRESALAALQVWSNISTPLALWQGGRQQIKLNHAAGLGLNAEYNRRSLSFQEWDTEDRTIQTGASTDAVAHEVGHAVLDSIRPELWDSTSVEPAAFHEAFADCLALLVGLFDKPTRLALLDGGSRLGAANFLESVAEEVADGVLREQGRFHPQSKPRHARNNFRWRRLSNVPRRTNSPSILTTEPHSFSRIFTGCFYDTIVGLFEVQADRSEQGLLAAARIAGRLLASAVTNAPQVRRFFQAVGQAMMLADEVDNNGLYNFVIRDAFRLHGIVVAGAAMLTPTSELNGPSPRLLANGTVTRLSAGTRRHLLQQIGEPIGCRLKVTPVRLGGKNVANTEYRREVRLASVGHGLRGVVARVAESVLIGSHDGRAVILGELPDKAETIAEAERFVSTLLEHDDVRMPTRQRRRGSYRARRHTPCGTAVARGCSTGFAFRAARTAVAVERNGGIDEPASFQRGRLTKQFRMEWAARVR